MKNLGKTLPPLAFSLERLPGSYLDAMGNPAAPQNARTAFTINSLGFDQIWKRLCFQGTQNKQLQEFTTQWVNLENSKHLMLIGS